MKNGPSFLSAIFAISLFSTNTTKCQVLMQGNVSTREILSFDSLMANLSEYSSSRNRAYSNALFKSTKCDGWRHKIKLNNIISLAQKSLIDSAHRELAKIPSNDVYYRRALSVISTWGTETAVPIAGRFKTDSELGQYTLTSQVLDRAYASLWDKKYEVPNNIQFIQHVKDAIDELEKDNPVGSAAYFEKAKSLIAGSWQQKYYQKAQAIASVIQSPDKSIPTWYEIGLDTIILDGDIQFYSEIDNPQRHRMISLYSNREFKRRYVIDIIKNRGISAEDSSLIRNAAFGTIDLTFVRQATEYGVSKSRVDQEILQADSKIKSYNSMLTYGYWISSLSLIGLIISYINYRKKRKINRNEIQQLGQQLGQTVINMIKVNKQISDRHEERLTKIEKTVIEDLTHRTHREV